MAVGSTPINTAEFSQATQFITIKADFAHWTIYYNSGRLDGQPYGPDNPYGPNGGPSPLATLFSPQLTPSVLYNNYIDGQWVLSPTYINGQGMVTFTYSNGQPTGGVAVLEVGAGMRLSLLGQHVPSLAAN